MSQRGVAFAIAIAIGVIACGKDTNPSGTNGGGTATGTGAPAPSLTQVLKHDAPPLPEACKAWQAAMTRYLACDRVPADVRDAIAKAFAATTAQWPKLADRDELGDACATGLEGIETQLGAAGCR